VEIGDALTNETIEHAFFFPWGQVGVSIGNPKTTTSSHRNFLFWGALTSLSKLIIA
jgi:hypothetical protein